MCIASRRRWPRRGFRVRGASRALAVAVTGGGKVAQVSGYVADAMTASDGADFGNLLADWSSSPTTRC
jgi:hypothetical protein